MCFSSGEIVTSGFLHPGNNICLDPFINRHVSHPTLRSVKAIFMNEMGYKPLLVLRVAMPAWLQPSLSQNVDTLFMEKINKWTSVQIMLF